jgi:PTS system nitrogen regulatory IIA component
MNLTVRDVCGLLGVSEKTVYRWINEGALPAHRVHDRYRFNRAELLEWATARRITVSAELFNEPEREAETASGLVEALQDGGIFHQVGGADKASVLRAMVEHMRVPQAVDRAFLLHLILAREALQSTGVGDGIAIPHVRNPIVQHVPRAMITLCFLARPVEFDAVDGKPVGALFSLISPTVRAHLRLLSRLSFALHDDGFRRVIVRQGSPDEVLAEASRIECALQPHGEPRESAR